jgi:glycosyltransferase involved in cell wall biosynthesis
MFVKNSKKLQNHLNFKMSKKTVAIIIPTFNRADKICKAIDSALLQSYESEIIVVDHGSVDETPQKVAKYGDKIKYIRKEQDFGPHFCWLDGIMNTNAQFIHMQFDDDWIENNFIEECVKLMEEDVGMVFCDAAIVDLKTQKTLNICHHFKGGKATSGIYCNKELEKELVFSRHRLISPGACLYRKQDLIDAFYQGNLPLQAKEIYRGVGPDLFASLIAILRYKKFGYINKPLACFGAHEDSITVDAFLNESKAKKLIAGYDAVRIYYLALKNFAKFYKIYGVWLKIRNFRMKDFRKWIRKKIK